MTTKAVIETKSGARRWVVRRDAEGAAPALARALGVSEVVAGLLAARGVTAEESARTLLRPSLEQLHDPHLMLGMREAAARVLRAVDAGERILIYGDYDVDGTTGTVVLRRALEVLGARTGERRVVQQRGTGRALAELALGAPGETAVVVVAGEGWHRGVVGLAASKICEKLGRPAVVISLEEDGTGHGSARSTDSFHMLDALTSCADLLEAFGGHAHAAGLSVRRENVAELRRRLNEHAARVLCAEDGVPCLDVDMELPAAALSLELCAELEALEPFGAGWPRPVFATRGLRVVGEPRVVQEPPLKFRPL